MRSPSFLAFSLFVSAFPTGSALGELTLPSVFSDGLILQREKGAKVWGWAGAGQKVVVTFGEQEKEGTAGSDGRWEVTLDDLAASAQGEVLWVRCGQESKRIEEVLVGEVWLASGQSNMEWKVKNSDGAEDAIASSADSLLRVFVTPNIAKSKVQKDFPGKWALAGAETTGSFPAVGYYFAHRLREELGVPVAIIECAWGGMPIEAFTSEEALRELSESAAILKKKERAIDGWDQEGASAKFEEALAVWEEDKEGRRPRMPVDPIENPRFHSTIYQGMIAPLAGFSIRGALWYQGEANANEMTASHYGELLTTMVADWRERWEDDFSFYYVQLANFQKPVSKAGTESQWVRVQDEMRRALETIPESGMAVINELGERDNIHPTNKHEVGARLARYALARDYDKAGIVTGGPLFAKGEVVGESVVITFENAKGLKSRDGESLKHFEIRSLGGPWHWAESVEVRGDQVAVSSSEVSEPVAVRYAWAQNPSEANLVNGAGLPASVFTTEEMD